MFHLNVGDDNDDV